LQPRPVKDHRIVLPRSRKLVSSLELIDLHIGLRKGHHLRQDVHHPKVLHLIPLVLHLHNFDTSYEIL